MAFAATTVVTQQAFTEMRQLCVTSKAYLQNRRALLVQATVLASVLLELVNHFRTMVLRLNELAATPGLAAYAKDQVDNQAYDIAAEYVVMRDSMIAARDGIAAALPKDGSGFLLYQTMAADGLISIRAFSAAQVASAVVMVDAVIANIS